MNQYTPIQIATLKAVAAEHHIAREANGGKTTTDQRLANFADLEARTVWRRVQRSSRLGWYYHTQGNTMKSGFKTEAAARKHMRNADADSAYWEAFHGGQCQ